MTEDQQERPLIIPILRSSDTNTPLYHRFTYLSLIKDIFDVKNNVFEFKTEKGSEFYEIGLSSPDQTYAVSDKIMFKHAYTEYNIVCKELGEEISKFGEEESHLQANA